MKGKWANLLAITIVCPLLAFAEDTPSPELLELLGQFEAMEELGVDVQHLIEMRLREQQLPAKDATDSGSSALEPTQ